MVWCDATVPVVTALLAWCWFTSRPVRREPSVAFVIISRSAGDFSTGAGSHHQVVGRLTGHGASSLDLELRGQGPRWFDWPRKLRP
jgi:hypothetical protein